MTDRENFLARWSRRKQEAAQPERPAPKPGADEPAPTPDDVALPATPSRAASAPAGSPKPAFDPASLPPLESITAATDMRAFLAPGVPAELTRAALRRAWAADPAIRDFVGLAENAWDFTKPGEIPGFGDLPLGTDVKKLVAQVFGDPDEAANRAAFKLPVVEQEDAQAQPVAGESPAPVLSGSSPDIGAQEPAVGMREPKPAAVAQLPGDSSNIVQCINVCAPQNRHSESSDDRTKIPRSHGRALPK
jgi:hypothetical protein